MKMEVNTKHVMEVNLDASEVLEALLKYLKDHNIPKDGFKLNGVSFQTPEGETVAGSKMIITFSKYIDEWKKGQSGGA